MCALIYTQQIFERTLRPLGKQIRTHDSYNIPHRTVQHGRPVLRQWGHFYRFRFEWQQCCSTPNGLFKLFPESPCNCSKEHFNSNFWVERINSTSVRYSYIFLWCSSCKILWHAGTGHKHVALTDTVAIWGFSLMSVGIHIPRGKKLPKLFADVDALQRHFDSAKTGELEDWYQDKTAVQSSTRKSAVDSLEVCGIRRV